MFTVTVGVYKLVDVVLQQGVGICCQQQSVHNLCRRDELIDAIFDRIYRLIVAVMDEVFTITVSVDKLVVAINIEDFAIAVGVN